MLVLGIYGKWVMGTLWRHPRPKLKNLVKICAGFVNRRKTPFND
jgi:hypothetical protein